MDGFDLLLFATMIGGAFWLDWLHARKRADRARRRFTQEWR